MRRYGIYWTCGGSPGTSLCLQSIYLLGEGMSLFYTAAYSLGFAPWEKAATHPPAARHIDALFEHEEQGRCPP